MEMTGYGRGGKPKAGFPRRPQPLEIAAAAISTFPQPRRFTHRSKSKAKSRRTVCDGKVEIQNQDSHFPTAPTACGARKEIVSWTVVHGWKPEHQKGDPTAVASLPPPGSSFN